MAYSYTFILTDKIESCYYDCPFELKCNDSGSLICPLSGSNITNKVERLDDCPMNEISFDLEDIFSFEEVKR